MSSIELMYIHFDCEILNSLLILMINIDLDNHYIMETAIKQILSHSTSVFIFSILSNYYKAVNVFNYYALLLIQTWRMRSPH